MNQQEAHQAKIRKMNQESADSQILIKEEITVLQAKLEGLLGFKQQHVCLLE